jgi:hypothetical protein
MVSIIGIKNSSCKINMIQFLYYLFSRLNFSCSLRQGTLGHSKQKEEGTSNGKTLCQDN